MSFFCFTYLDISEGVNGLPSISCHLASYKHTVNKKEVLRHQIMLVWVKEGIKAMTDISVSVGKPVLTANQFMYEKTGVKKLLSMGNIVQLKLQIFPSAHGEVLRSH